MPKISICQICNTSFKPGPGCKGLYCSKQCSYKGLSEKNKLKNTAVREAKDVQNPRHCLQCSSKITGKYAKKFCNNSCSAIWHNNRRTYKKRQPGNCLACGKELNSVDRKYCSNICQQSLRKIEDSAHHKKINAIRQSKYRAKKLRLIHPTADKERIKQIYLNCPPGYEVDHIVPLSLGGFHHENNLQYLTIEENRRKGNRWVG